MVLTFFQFPRTAIAHSVREQLQSYAKSLLLVEHHFDGKPVDDEELASCFLPAVSKGPTRRDAISATIFGPQLLELRHAEIAKLEKDREREFRQAILSENDIFPVAIHIHETETKLFTIKQYYRRKRRQTNRNRRTITLPDRDLIKTNRTVLPPTVLDPANVTSGTIMQNPSIYRQHSGIFLSIPQPVLQPLIGPSPLNRHRRGTGSRYDHGDSPGPAMQTPPGVSTNGHGVIVYRCMRCAGAVTPRHDMKPEDALCDTCCGLTSYVNRIINYSTQISFISTVGSSSSSERRTPDNLTIREPIRAYCREGLGLGSGKICLTIVFRKNDKQRRRRTPHRYPKTPFPTGSLPKNDVYLNDTPSTNSS
jgi:hypothetical protein